LELERVKGKEAGHLKKHKGACRGKALEKKGKASAGRFLENRRPTKAGARRLPGYRKISSRNGDFGGERVMVSTTKKRKFAKLKTGQ